MPSANLVRMFGSPPLSRGCATATSLAAAATTRKSVFAGVPLGPPDAILGVTQAYNADPSPLKINLGVGAYRDSAGKPFVLSAVRAAEKRLFKRSMNMEYLPVVGHRDFVAKSLRLAYGSASAALADGCVAGMQTLSGTGACRMAGELIARFFDAPGRLPKPLVLLPNPTWANHSTIFKDAGCDVAIYDYYDPATNSVNGEKCLASLETAKPGSVVLLHATAHNPTGADPSVELWAEMSSVMARRGLIPLFDSAYQGFTSGNADTDAASLRKFVEDGHRVLLAQSFSKNMGLYGHRVGCVSAVCDSPDEARAVDSQLQILARAIWSNPPLYGARVANEILDDPELDPLWRVEMQSMADRIKSMRTDLRNHLSELGSSHNWDHIVRQNGMFCFSGLTKDHVRTLAADHSVYLTANGRISMAGVCPSNVEYLAKSIYNVTE